MSVHQFDERLETFSRVYTQSPIGIATPNSGHTKLATTRIKSAIMRAQNIWGS